MRVPIAWTDHSPGSSFISSSLDDSDSDHLVEFLEWFGLYCSWISGMLLRYASVCNSYSERRAASEAFALRSRRDVDRGVALCLRRGIWRSLGYARSGERSGIGGVRAPCLGMSCTCSVASAERR